MCIGKITEIFKKTKSQVPCFFNYCPPFAIHSVLMGALCCTHNKENDDMDIMA